MATPLSSKTFLVLAAAIAVAGVLAYHNAPGNGSTNFDDYWQVTRNPLVTEPSFHNGVRAVSGPYHGVYLPAKLLSYMADYAVCRRLGLDPVLGVHLTNVILHIANSILVALICILVVLDLAGDRIDPAGAFLIGLFAGVLFVLHPVHVESVAWLSSRKDVLSFFFMALAFLAFRGVVMRGTLVRGVMCVVLFILALASKNTVLCFPLIAAAYWVLVSRRGGRRAGFVLAALIIVAAVDVVAGATLISAAGYGAKPTGGSWAIHYLTVIKTFPLYMRLLLFPVGLNAIYRIPTASGLSDPGVWWGLVMLTANICVVVFVRVKTARFIVLWYLIALLPVLQLVPMAVPAFAADRYAYIASVPFALAPALILWKVREALLKRGSTVVASALVAAAVIYAGALGVGTWSRNRVWRSSKTLWQDVLSKNPTSRIALVNLGEVHFEEGDYQRARRHYTKAITLDPFFTIARYNLALTCERVGDEAVAKTLYKQVLVMPSSLTARYARRYRGLAACKVSAIYYDRREYVRARKYAADALAYLGKAPEPTQRYRQADEALTQSRELADGLIEAGDALAKSAPARAERLYVHAGEAAIEYSAPHTKLGRLYLAARRWQDAYEELTTAFLLGARGADFEYDFGVAALESGRYDRAARRFARVLAADPARRKAKVKLAVAEAHLGKQEKALKALEEILGADPGNREAREIYDARKASLENGKRDGDE
ncbi:MAG: tetratricopeptide repeat protein [Planctomycetes bacterium]|nr:tetratricopeptide repeat protein [Planctomycetota bacterium]